MRRKGRKAARFGKQCARWLRPAAIALLLLFAWSLGQSNVFERLAPAPSPQPVRRMLGGRMNAVRRRKSAPGGALCAVLSLFPRFDKKEKILCKKPLDSGFLPLYAYMEGKILVKTE